MGQDPNMKRTQHINLTKSAVCRFSISLLAVAGLALGQDQAAQGQNQQGQNQQATNAASYQNSLVTQATAALSNATGVNLDTEMTNMLNIENTYTTTAKLLTTVDAMFSALISAV